MRETETVGKTHPSLVLTVEDVATKLRISVRSVWRLDAKNLMPNAIRVGGATRWRAADIDGWVDAGCPDRATFEQLQDIEGPR